jgi:hypothetical protein
MRLIVTQVESYFRVVKLSFITLNSRDKQFSIQNIFNEVQKKKNLKSNRMILNMLLM